jgi:hypothetical protein
LEKLIDRLASTRYNGPPPTPRPLKTVQDVIDLLHEQIEAVRADSGVGALEKARAIGQLLSIAQRALQTGDVAAKLKLLEEVLKQRNEGTRS